jgi:predicted Zn-dependent peptidase
MKTTVFISLFAAAVLMFGSALAQDVDKLDFPDLNELQVPNVEKVTLDNGIRIYILPDNRLPIFRASVRVNCGAYLEPADKIGLSDMCGEVLRTGGTAKWTGDEIDEALESVGGSVETSIGNLSGNASVRVLTEYTDLGLEILAEILRRPTFDEDKLELAKVQQRSAISRRNDNPQGTAFREFRKAVYGPESVYARHTEYATVNAVTRDDLLEFHKKWFHPENIQIAVWGDVKKDDIVEKIKMYFSDWEPGNVEVPPPPEVDYQFDQHVFYAEKSDVNQSNVLVGHIGGLVTDEDYADRIVMNSIFGGSFGSRLFNSVRSREGLAYATFGSYTANISYPGMFIAFASTKSESTGKAIKEIINQIEGMQTDSPTEEEMRKGTEGYVNSFVFNFDSKSEVVNRMMNYDFYSLPEDFLFQEKEKVEQVTADAVVAAAKNNLHPDQLRVLVVGKKDDFEVPLEELGLGAVTEIDLTIPSGEEKRELAVTEENLAKGKELVQRAAEAHGGVAAFKAIENVARKGTFTIVTPNGEIPLSFEEIDVYPDKNYSKAITPMGAMSSAWLGDRGWREAGPQGVLDMTEEDLIQNRKDRARATIALFASADSPDYQAVYDGGGSLSGSSVEYVVILDGDGETICRLAFDASSGALVYKSFWGSGPMGGEGQIEEYYENVTESGGVRMPMKIVRMMDGQKIASVEMTEQAVNVEVDESLFEKPM